MAYTIKKTNGQILLTLQDGTLDTSKSSLTLVGKNYPGYGEIVNDNLVRMLENFANNTSPVNPLVGQLWYDTAAARLTIYNGSIFKGTSATTVSLIQPSQNSDGDFWFKPDTGQLYAYTGNAFSLIGPTALNNVITCDSLTATSTVTTSYLNVNNNADITLQMKAGSIVSTGLGSGRVIFSGSSPVGVLSSDSTFKYDSLSQSLITNNVIATTATITTGKFLSGSTAAPSVTNNNDTNTGVWWPASDTIAISTGGTERLRVTTTGVSLSNTIGVALNIFDGTVNTQFGTAGGTDFYINTSTASKLRFGTNALSRLEISSAGNLVVNTPTSGDTLTLGQVAGSAQLVLNGSTSGTVSIKTTATPTSYTLTLPPNAGSAGQVLQTDGTGVTTWAAGFVGSSGGGFTGSRGFTGSVAIGPTGFTGSAGGGASPAAPLWRHVTAGYTGGGQVFVTNSTPVASAQGDIWLDTSATAGYTQSLASTGWSQLPNGLIIQWGLTTITPGITTTITFPKTFPAACFSFTFSDYNISPNDSNNRSSHSVVGAPTTVSAKVFSSTGTAVTAVYWMAIGH